MTPVDILSHARELLAQPGVWGQDRDLRDDDRKCCTMALGAGLGADGYEAAVMAFADAIGTFRIVHWNDTPGRTLAEVLSAFDRAIEIAKRRAA